MTRRRRPWPGVSVGVPFERYRADPALNVSALKHLRRSPAHFRHALAEPGDPTPAQAFGSLVHLAVLEPDRYARDVVVWSQTTESGAAAPRRGKAWEQFAAEHAGRTIVTAAEHAEAGAIRDAVRADATAMRYLARGFAEVVVHWQRDRRPLKARLDWLCEVDGELVVVDLKTARDVAPLTFGASAARLRVPMQLAYYVDAVEHATGRTARAVVVAVESGPPYAVAVFAVGDDVLELGRTQYTAALATVTACEARGEWPGPVVGEQPLILPTWAWPDGGEDSTTEGLDWGEEAAA